MARYASDDSLWVRVGRFLNILDDEFNKLSPVKFNAWAANFAALSTCIGTAFAWIGGHLGGIETVWGGTIAWLTQAHVTHHMDKKERNRAKGKEDV
jgi:hypothetical protein